LGERITGNRLNRRILRIWGIRKPIESRLGVLVMEKKHTAGAGKGEAIKGGKRKNRAACNMEEEVFWLTSQTDHADVRTTGEGGENSISRLKLRVDSNQCSAMKGGKIGPYCTYGPDGGGMIHGGD